MASPPRRPILIAGAGLASLLFAQALRRAAIPFLIFERDQSITFRAQGYRLRLSAQGIDAVEAVLDAEDFQVFWDTCGKTGGSGLLPLDAKTGQELPAAVVPQATATAVTAAGPVAEPVAADQVDKLESRNTLVSRGGQVVGIARGELRRLFMRGCEEFVQWSHTVVGYRELPEAEGGGVRAVFADGSESVDGEMLVAGDGLYSRVARQVSGGRIRVYDTGARGIHGEAPTTAFLGLGEGVWRIVDDSRPGGRVFLITNVRPRDMHNPNINFGWTLATQPGVIHPPNNDFSIVGPEAARIAKQLTAEWHPRFKPLFDHMVEAEAAFWRITCSTPAGVPEWPSHPRVTLLGDAAHAMTPAGGNGANTAMRDSALLGRLLAEAGGYRDDVVAAYEKEMRVYASEAVRLSYTNSKHQFGVSINQDTPFA